MLLTHEHPLAVYANEFCVVFVVGVFDAALVLLFCTLLV
jgi:hypothetical protein